MPRLRSVEAQPRTIAQIRAAEKSAQAPRAIGKVPSCLSQAERLIWRELSSSVPPGHLGPEDRVMLEIAVRLIAEMRQDAAEFPAARLGQLRAALSNLGLGPIARQALQATVAQAAAASVADPSAKYFD